MIHFEFGLFFSNGLVQPPTIIMFRSHVGFQEGNLVTHSVYHSLKFVKNTIMAGEPTPPNVPSSEIREADG